VINHHVFIELFPDLNELFPDLKLKSRISNLLEFAEGLGPNYSAEP
jgi:hypothetical protein